MMKRLWVSMAACFAVCFLSQNVRADETSDSYALLISLAARCNAAIELGDSKLASGVFQYAAKKYGEQHAVVALMRHALNGNGIETSSPINAQDKQKDSPKKTIIIGAYKTDRLSVFAKGSEKVNFGFLIEYLKGEMIPVEWGKGDHVISADEKQRVLVVKTTRDQHNRLRYALRKLVDKSAD